MPVEAPGKSRLLKWEDDAMMSPKCNSEGANTLASQTLQRRSNRPAIPSK